MQKRCTAAGLAHTDETRDVFVPANDAGTERQELRLSTAVLAEWPGGIGELPDFD